MRWDRTVRVVGVVVIVVFFLSIFTPIANFAGHALALEPSVDASDAIVVLGAGVARDGTLNNRSVRRTLYALRLYKRGLARWLVLSGPGTGSGPAESAVRADMARELSVPAGAILEVRNDRTTLEESRQIASLLTERNLKRILLVTDSLHMRRAKLVFERAGLEVWPAPSDNWSNSAVSPEQRLELILEVLVESAGLLYYRLAAYI